MRRYHNFARDRIATIAAADWKRPQGATISGREYAMLRWAGNCQRILCQRATPRPIRPPAAMHRPTLGRGSKFLTRNGLGR